MREVTCLSYREIEEWQLVIVKRREIYGEKEEGMKHELKD